MNILSKIADRFKKKSGSLSGDFDLLGFNFLNRVGWHEVRASMAWNFWAQIHVINRATRLISQEVASIKPVIREKSTGEIFTEFNPRIPATRAFKLLEQPNLDRTYIEFITAQISSMLVTGESYIITATATDRSDFPSMMFWQNPKDVTVISDGSFMPSQFIVNRPEQSTTFTRDNSDHRYYSPDRALQAYQIVDFNPFYEFGNQRGFSRLSSVFFAIEEYIEGNKANISMLKKGARPSGLFQLEDVTSNEQVKEIKNQLQQFYSGSENTGNVIVTNKGRNFIPLNLSNKDMDYAELSKMAMKSMYEIFEIPSSFFDTSASSFNNKLNDRINLYIFAILPIATRFYEELTRAIYFDQNKFGNFEITFIKKDIPALELLFDESNLRKSQSGVFTINELRNTYGLDDIGTAGDVLYQPITLAPIGQPVEENKSIKDDKLKKVLDVINKSN